MAQDVYRDRHRAREGERQSIKQRNIQRENYYWRVPEANIKLIQCTHETRTISHAHTTATTLQMNVKFMPTSHLTIDMCMISVCARQRTSELNAQPSQVSL